MNTRKLNPLVTVLSVPDATGPAQSSYHRWLKNAGFSPLPTSLQDEYDPCLSYAQAVYTLPDKLLPEVEKLFPYGLTPGSLLSNVPEPASGEMRVLYLYWTEDSHRKSVRYSFDVELLSHFSLLLLLIELIIASGGWGATKEQRPHRLDEIREYTKTLDNAKATPPWIFKLFDLLEEYESECSPWVIDFQPGKMSFIKYHEAQKGTLPSNWVAVGDAAVKLNPIYGAFKYML